MSSIKRELNDWISAYLKYVENTEPPISYHTWTAVSMIAGALQRKVYLNWGHDTIYPNMYIVLIGPSGRARKGTAMNIGKDILKDIGISMTSESITREALIRDMKDAVTNFPDATTGKVRFHCSLTALSEELSVFLGQNDIKFLADLTDWYDSRDSWTYRTKGSGTDKIQGVCFNILGATAPDWLQSILPQEAVGGGFTSRIIFVVEETKAGIHMDQPTNRPILHKVAGAHKLGMMHDHVGFGAGQPGFVARGDERGDFVGVHGHRLLHQNVFARPQGEGD